jgi:hypothetical protein
VRLTIASAPVPPPRAQRLLGRLVTSPAAFLAAGAADWAVLCWRWASARARGRDVEW